MFCSFREPHEHHVFERVGDEGPGHSLRMSLRTVTAADWHVKRTTLSHEEDVMSCHARHLCS